MNLLRHKDFHVYRMISKLNKVYCIVGTNAWEWVISVVIYCGQKIQTDTCLLYTLEIFVAVRFFVILRQYRFIELRQDALNQFVVCSYL